MVKDTGLQIWQAYSQGQSRNNPLQIFFRKGAWPGPCDPYFFFGGGLNVNCFNVVKGTDFKLTCAAIALLISAPSLGVYYFFCRWLCLSVRLSVCLSRTNFKLILLFCFSMESSQFLAVSVLRVALYEMLFLDFGFVAMATKFGLFLQKNSNCFFFSRWNRAIFGR